jgi:hypothetical protein
MRNASRLFVCAVLAAAALSCGDVVRQGTSPVFLGLDSLQGAAGPSLTFASVLFSDVQRIVITPAPCTAESPCPTSFADLGQATFRLVPKDVTGATTSPTTNSDVTISRYHVSFRRADGRNTQGVDVPFAFDGAVTALVSVSGGGVVGFELVRHVAKQESPLVQLVTSHSIITTFADVTFYGKDRVGNDVTASGTIQVDFGNFGDI